MLSCSDDETVPSLTLNLPEITVSNGGGFQIIPFESNVSWTAKSSESWCVVYPASGDASTKSITVTAATNESYDARSCNVTIVAGGVSKTVTINQSSNLGLLVTKDKYDLSNDSTTIDVEVKANVEFDVTIAGDWITRITTRGLTSTQLHFNIAKNESYDNRKGSIEIKQKDGVLRSTVNIYQSQENAIILSNKTEDLSSDSQTLEIELKTNVDFEVVIPEAAKSWVSYTGTRGLRTETLLLNISKNEKYDDRSTEIYVKNKATNLQETLTITQSANTKPILIAPANNLTDANRLPTFRWSEVKNHDGHKFSYKYEYSENLDSWEHSYNLNETVFNLTDYLVANKRYYWRVAAINSYDGSITYSGVNSFTTGTKKSYFDGEYKVAMAHTKGVNPSKILFLGDGYISEDFEEGGQFDADMDEGIEAFFAVEPYKSYREYFTVYKQAAYSKDRGVKQTDRNIFKDSKFSTNFEGSTRLTTDYNKVFEYATKIPGVDYQNLNNFLISLVVNEDRYAGTCYLWSDGKAIAISPVSRSMHSNMHFSSIINHEAGGHGFGKLADEYVSYSESIPESERNNAKSWENLGFYSNVDFTGDRSQVKWRYMIGVPGYDRVSTFEGGYYYSHGVWRPETSSCMISNVKYYNAPSREAIVKRIYKTAGLQYTFEAFMRKDIEREPSRSTVIQTRSIDPLTFVPLAPPVMVE